MTDETPPAPLLPKFELTPQARLIAILFGVVLLALAALYFLVLRQDYAVLYQGLRPADAAAITQALKKQGVRYQLRNGGTEILVPTAKADSAKLQLASSNLSPGGAEGFEMFNESDLGMTEFAQKIRYQRALQGELTRTIMMMDGIAEARVHLSLPERTLFRSERKNAEAAVTLLMRAGEIETPALVEGVQRLVAASAPDLAVSDVVVLNAHGEVISARIELHMAASQSGARDASSPSLDFVTAVVRRAMPNRQFDISIEETPALAGAPDENGEETIAVSPGPTRVIDIIAATPATAEEIERVRDDLRRAGLIDGLTGGSLSFRARAAAAPERTTAQVQSPGRSDEHTMSPAWLLYAGLALAIGFLLLQWWRGRPRLSAEDHQHFAEMLKSRLRSEQAEEAHG